MLSRSIQGNFVCLQCRLHSGVSALQRYQIPTQLASRARQSSSVASPHEDAQAHEEDRRAGPEIRYVENSDRNRVYRRAKPGAKPGRSSHAKQVYKSRGQKLVAKEEQLDIDILGKPAHAIVLKNFVPRRPDQAKGRDNLEAADETSGPAASLDLSDALESESSEPTPEEVLQNIDELRPVDVDVVTQRKFEAERDVLVRGFTKAQLQAYIFHRSHAQSEAAEDLGRHWILRRWQWLPDGEIVPGASPSLRGYISKSMPAKELLATQLMRLCWNLSIQEINDAQGSLYVQLREVEFSMLLLGTNRWLRSASRKFANQGLQIELFRSSNIMRIAAPKVVAENVINEINDILEGMVTKSFSLDAIAGEGSISQAALQEVGRITNTNVRLDDTGKKLLVSYVDFPPPPEKMEKLDDIVLRLLVGGFKKRQYTTSSLSVESLNDVPDKALDNKGKTTSTTTTSAFIVDYNNSYKWSWKDRIAGSWARLALPTRTKPLTRPPEAGAVADVLSNVLRHPVAAAELPLFSDVASVGWSPSLRSLTSATYGHILHAQPSGATPFSPGTIDEEGLSASPRLLSPIIPQLSSLNFETVAAPNLSSSTILLRFLPVSVLAAARDQDAQALSAPILEVRLETKDDEIISIVSVRAITDSHTGDALVPSAPVDVRLQQTRYYEILGHDISDTNGKSLLEFLQDSQLKPEQGQLLTPARMPGFLVPKRMLKSSSDLDVPGSERHTATEPHDTGEAQEEEAVEIDYLFAGLELQRTATTNYNGWLLTYTSIEAGQGGGQRAELSLEATTMPQLGEAGSEANLHDQASFLGAASRILQGDDIKWYGSRE